MCVCIACRFFHVRKSTCVYVYKRRCDRKSLYSCIFVRMSMCMKVFARLPCMFACTHAMHMHACMYFVSIHLCMHTCQCVCLVVYVSLYTCMHLFTYVFLHACKRESMSTCRNVWYVRMCVYLCIHAHNYYVCMHTCLSKQMHACVYVARMSYACLPVYARMHSE